VQTVDRNIILLTIEYTILFIIIVNNCLATGATAASWLGERHSRSTALYVIPAAELFHGSEADPDATQSATAQDFLDRELFYPGCQRFHGGSVVKISDVYRQLKAYTS
jgi:hypothetical protein